MPPFDLDTYAADVARPISSGDETVCPAGEPVAYDDDFLSVKAQIDALKRLGGRIDQSRVIGGEGALCDVPAGPDFELVAKTGRRILTDRSKDLRTACYVTLALHRLHGAAGLAAGLKGLESITDSFWTNMHPSPVRMRARQAVLAFLVRHLQDDLPEDPSPTDVPPEDAVAVEGAIRCLKSLSARWTDLMGDAAPATQGLLDRLRLLKAAASGVSSPQDGDSESPKPDPQASRESSSVGTGIDEAVPEVQSPATDLSEPEITDGDDRHADGTVESIPAIESAVIRWAGRIRDADAKDPRSYRLLRLLRWDPIGEPPPSEQGRTRLPPPDPALRRTVQRLAGQNNALLIEQAEAAFQRPPVHFWLDLQRFLIEALGRAGAPFDSARTAVVTEAKRLLDRVPGLVDLRFSDGTPLATSDTKRWMDQQGRPSQPPTSPPGDPVAAVVAEATDHLSSTGLSAAIDHLQKASGLDHRPITRYRLRLATADLCLDGDRPELAHPLLRSLVAEGRRRRLDRWDPDLLATAWTQLYHCYRRLAEPSGGEPPPQGRTDWTKRAEQARDQVGRLAPDRALSLFPPFDDSPNDRR